MKIRKIFLLLLTSLLLFSLVSCSVDTGGQEQEIDNSKLNIHFLDVGQADSIFITMPDGKSMLIDAGNNEDGKGIVKYLEGLGIARIDVLIGTHPHEDHIGGMDDVIKGFDIGKFYMPKASSNTKTFEDVLDAANAKGLKIVSTRAGTNIVLSDEVAIEVLAPNSQSYEDLNNYSIVLRLTYGDKRFLFMGDAEKLSEIEMLKRGYDLNSDLIKIGHHGSSSSTSEEFLAAVSPEYAVISVGEGNDYGHPHKETMDLLKKYGITVYRTDECGTVVASSDGENITFNVESGDYKYNSK
ncbi:MAG: ComEC/Rec2 family competence protein [Thermoanaerobacteraceae bacterium]|nr:ComEC/Rec2 family competence protein [Thermoanaerobacteraceae bacterium]